MKDIEKCEDLFNEFHGEEDIDRKSRVLDRFAKVLENHFGSKYDKKLYMFFAKARTYIRMKALVLKVREAKKNKKTARYFKKLGHLTQD